jgi:hypothetical protein
MEDDDLGVSVALQASQALDPRLGPGRGRKWLRNACISQVVRQGLDRIACMAILAPHKPDDSATDDMATEGASNEDGPGRWCITVFEFPDNDQVNRVEHAFPPFPAKRPSWPHQSAHSPPPVLSFAQFTNVDSVLVQYGPTVAYYPAEKKGADGPRENDLRRVMGVLERRGTTLVTV